MKVNSIVMEDSATLTYVSLLMLMLILYLLLGCPTLGIFFNCCYPRTRFYKYIGYLNNRGYFSMTNRGYTYTYGHNCVERFNPDANCEPDGLYFSDQNNIRHFSGFGAKLYRVQVPSTALVSFCIGIGNDKWKANALIISDIDDTDSQHIQALAERKNTVLMNRQKQFKKQRRRHRKK